MTRRDALILEYLRKPRLPKELARDLGLPVWLVRRDLIRAKVWPVWS
jgi:hypothetical protein